jgi:hypothetical protein
LKHFAGDDRLRDSNRAMAEDSRGECEKSDASRCTHRAEHSRCGCCALKLVTPGDGGIETHMIDEVALLWRLLGRPSVRRHDAAPVQGEKRNAG